MPRLLSPVCLILCLALLVMAFALLATDAPEPNVQLHGARARGDEAFEQVLERDLQRRIWFRRGVIAALFAAAFASGVAGFCALSGTARS